MRRAKAGKCELTCGVGSGQGAAQQLFTHPRNGNEISLFLENEMFQTILFPENGHQDESGVCAVDQEGGLHLRRLLHRTLQPPP